MSLARGVAATGVILLVAPLAVPRLDLGEYLLPLASAGFLLVLEPWNAMVGRTGLWLQARSGNYSLPAALAGAGLLCGLWLDALNYLSHSKWHSLWTFTSAGAPFELPWAVYAVLPLFSWQAFAMYQFATGLLNLPRSELGSPCSGATAGQVAKRARASLLTL